MNIDLRNHKALLQELDELYPLRNPSPNDTLDAIRYRSGQRSVVDLLLAELQYQEEQAVLTNQEVLGKPHV